MCGGGTSDDGFQKTRVKLLRLSISTGTSSRKTQLKNVESKQLFSDCAKKHDLGFSQQRMVTADKSDCVSDCLTKHYLANVLRIYKGSARMPNVGQGSTSNCSIHYSI